MSSQTLVQTTEFQILGFLGSLLSRKEEVLPFTTPCQDKHTLLYAQTYNKATIQVTSEFTGCHMES